MGLSGWWWIVDGSKEVLHRGWGGMGLSGWWWIVDGCVCVCVQKQLLKMISSYPSKEEMCGVI